MQSSFQLDSHVVPSGQLALHTFKDFLVGVSIVLVGFLNQTLLLSLRLNF